MTESEGPTPTVLSRQIDEAAAVMFREGPGEEAASGEGAPAVAVDPEGAPAVAVNPEAAVDQPEEDRPPPRGYDAAFRCPLCGELMTDPVILISSGESFERAALSQARGRASDGSRRRRGRRVDIPPFGRDRRARLRYSRLRNGVREG